LRRFADFAEAPPAMRRGATADTFPPPVMEARRWLEGVETPPDRPLLNMSQAAPVAPPPAPLREAMAEAVMEDAGSHLYGPVLGLPELRDEIAAAWTRLYGGRIEAAQVAVTPGCNQAFCAAVAALARPGDEVILPVPWYFNHKMWLDMSGVAAVPLATGDGLLPDPRMAARLVTPATRAIVLVSPNNPGGVEYPAAMLAAFRDLCRDRGIHLIVDETYRDFGSRSGAPHALFTDPDWAGVLVHLYSFSKAYRLTGHRVGAVVAAPWLLAEIEKFLDTVAICAPQLGQRAALWGLRHLGGWLAAERAEILSRAGALRDVFAALDGWRLLGCGAHFAYAEHPFRMPSDDLAPHLVSSAGVLLLPGTMFRPSADPRGAREVRIAFANADAAGLRELGHRLSRLDLARVG
jgi:aspartate/methionine/tyrosine aminotransferase